MSDPPVGSAPDRNPAGLLQWLRQGAWALADQGFASAGNFLANIILARILDPVAYGAFAVAYQCFWLLVTVHAAVIAEPMLVLAPGRYREARREYLRTVMAGQFGFAGIAGLLTALVAAVIWAFGHPLIATSLAGLALAAPSMLVLLSLRRVAYARFETRLAAFGGAANLLLILAGLVLVHGASRLTVVTAFAVLGAAALAVCAVLWRLLGLRNPLARPWPLARSVADEHRRYGRWGVAAGLLAWVPGNVFYLILPMLPGPEFGLQATAALRALANLIMPLLQANAALGSVVIPALSARRRAGRRLRIGPVATTLVGLSAVYWLGLVFAGEPLMAWIYGGRYAASPSLLALLGLIPVLTAVAHLLRGFILAHERPDHMFWAYLVASIVTVAAGVPLAREFQLHGVLAAMAMAPATQVAVMLGFARSSARRG